MSQDKFNNTEKPNSDNLNEDLIKEMFALSVPEKSRKIEEIETLVKKFFRNHEFRNKFRFARKLHEIADEDEEFEKLTEPDSKDQFAQFQELADSSLFFRLLESFIHEFNLIMSDYDSELMAQFMICSEDARTECTGDAGILNENKYTMMMNQKFVFPTMEKLVSQSLSLNDASIQIARLFYPSVSIALGKTIVDRETKADSIRKAYSNSKNKKNQEDV